MTTTTGPLDPDLAARLKRTDDEHGRGLVTAVVQQHDTGAVLMVGWMDDEALHRTLTTGRTTYWSRSRQEYWVKGDTSGHVQHVREVRLDCDGGEGVGAPVGGAIDVLPRDGEREARECCD